MAGSIDRVLIWAAVIPLGLSGAPAAAQQSPTQVKAQRDRAAREAAARAQAERKRPAAKTTAAANAGSRPATPEERWIRLQLKPSGIKSGNPAGWLAG